MKNERKKAVVLLSGGLDSATVLAIVSKDYDVYAVSFDYGQRHSVELERAKCLVQKNKAVKRHLVIKIDLRTIGGSALTSDEIAVPKDKYHEIKESDEIPITYVPARNTIFLSFALSVAEIVGSTNIFIGANVEDYSNYPDCRPDYLKAFGKMAKLATASGMQGHDIRIHAPLLMLSKSSIIKKGLELGVDYADTISCYDPDKAGKSCGHCDSCTIRQEAFKELGMKDPAR